jgi:hypothetical protein
MLRSFLPRAFHRCRPYRQLCRLRVEVLEDRLTPSTWIGGAHVDAIHTSGDPNAWTNPLNWLGGVPLPGDTPVFTHNVDFSLYNPDDPDHPTHYTTPFNENPVADQAVTIAGINVDSTWGDTGGIISGAQPISLTGASTWAGGILGGTVNNSGTLTLTGPKVKIIEDGTLTNAGTVADAGTGNLQLAVQYHTGFFSNLAGATFDFQADGNIRIDVASFDADLFTNAGTILKSGGAGTSALSCRFNNEAGTLDVRTGGLTIAGGGASTDGTFTVASAAVLNLTGGYGAPITYSGTYTGSGGGTVVFGGGTISTGGGATFAFDPGMFQWDAGTLVGDLTNTGTITLSGPVGGRASQDGTLTNAGTVVDTGTGGTQLGVYGHPGSFSNLAGATFDFQGDGNLYTDGDAGTFTNAGTVLKSGGTGTSAFVVRFNNTGGTLDVRTGGLGIGYGGHTGTSTGGTFNVAPGAGLNLTGGSSLTYSGTYTGSGGGTIVVGGGEISTGSGATFAFDPGMFQWDSGTLDGNLTNTGTLTLTGPAGKLFQYGTLTNAGTVVDAGTGGLQLDYADHPGYFSNLAGATFDFQADGTITQDSTAGGFTNAGTLLKSGGTGTSTFTNRVSLDNPGAVVVLSGTLNLNGPVAQASGATLTGGTWQVFAGATLNITSAGDLTTNNGNITLDGSGSSFSNIAHLLTNNGSLSILDGRNFMTVGSFANNGTLTIGLGSLFSVNGNYTQSSMAMLEVLLGGTADTGLFGQLNVSGTATLDGTLTATLVNGYTPTTGDTFAVLTYHSRNGDFATGPNGFDHPFDDANGVMSLVAQ